MAKRHQIGYIDPALRKLQRMQDTTTAEVLKELKKTQIAISKEIAYLSLKVDITKSAKQRARLYGLIEQHYKKLSEKINQHITSLLETTAKDAHKLAEDEIGGSGILAYSPQRTQRYLEMVSEGNSKDMAAVFTDKMSNEAIRQLRYAWVEGFREASLAGMTANDTQRLIQNKWDTVARNTDSFRFVDKAGRNWSNARYLQMLIRTNSQRVSVDSYIDTLAENGFKLARISDDGDADCPICAAWEGRIVQVAGESRKWPTYEDAKSAGVFHPNCTHRLEYMDATADEDEIKLQEGIEKPPAGAGTEFVQRQKDRIDEGRHRAEGFSADEARRAVTRDRLKRNALTGTFNTNIAGAFDKLTDVQLDEIRKNGIPRFLMTKRGENPGWNKGTRGGIVRIPRDAGPDDVLKAMGLKERTDPVVPSAEIEKKRITAVKQVHQRGKGKELFVCITPDGTVLQHDSGRLGGEIPAKMQVKDSVFVHNHPIGYQNIRHKTNRYGNSFSPDDLCSAASIKLKEIVAVTPRRIYSMAPGAIGWPTRYEMKKTVRNYERLVKSKLINSVRERRIDADTASVLHYHLVSKHVAKELGLKYSWKKNSK